MVERSPDGCALRQVRSGRVEAAQVCVLGRHYLLHCGRRVRDDYTGVGAAIDPAGRGASSDAGDAVPSAAIRLPFFVRDYCAACPPPAARSRNALGCDSADRDMEQSARRLFYGLGCDRGLRPRDHARGSLVRTRFPARYWNSCDCGRGDGVDSHNISNSACARHLADAYPFDSESDDALYDWRLDTVDTFAHERAMGQRRAEIFRAG